MLDRIKNNVTNEKKQEYISVLEKLAKLLTIPLSELPHTVKVYGFH